MTVQVPALFWVGVNCMERQTGASGPGPSVKSPKFYRAHLHRRQPRHVLPGAVEDEHGNDVDPALRPALEQPAHFFIEDEIGGQEVRRNQEDGCVRPFKRCTDLLPVEPAVRVSVVAGGPR